MSLGIVVSIAFFGYLLMTGKWWVALFGAAVGVVSWLVGYQKGWHDRR